MLGYGSCMMLVSVLIIWSPCGDLHNEYYNDIVIVCNVFAFVTHLYLPKLVVHILLEIIASL